MTRNKKKLLPPLQFSKATIVSFVIFILFVFSYRSNNSSFQFPVGPDGISGSSSIKKVDSLTKLIESRPQDLALIRCSPSKKDGNYDKANWSVCGIVGAVPKYEQRISINNSSTNSVEFVDDHGVSHKSQYWELMLLNFNQNTSQNTWRYVKQSLDEWQKANTWVRDIKPQELSTDSPILRSFYTTIGQQAKDIGKSPWNSSKAYIDRRILKVQQGVPLFKTNGKVIELAALQTGLSPYTPVHYSAPKSLSEYERQKIGFLYPEPPCKGAYRQAVLVHEPHNNKHDEAAFFFLLDYLQQQYPSVFGKLYIFQEGQPNNLNSSDSVFNLPPNGLDDKILKMLRDSRNKWNDQFYAPLNSKLNVSETDIQSFLKVKSLSIEKTWDKAFDFYKFREKSGALDIRTAIMANFRDRTNEQKEAERYINRFKNLKPNDAAFAKALIDGGLRGSLAYELYVEGNTSPTSSNSVFVHGLEDAGMYYASCALNLNCIGSDLSSVEPISLPSYSQDWRQIQPFRDWVMARTVVKNLEALDRNVVPVVAAAASTHLPLVREFLCKAGISTVTLATTNTTNFYLYDLYAPGEFNSVKLWRPPSNWYGTTPIMSYLTSSLAPLSPPQPGLARPLGEGISQILDTWLNNPGLF